MALQPLPTQANVIEFESGWYCIDYPGHFELRVADCNRDFSQEEIHNAVHNFLAFKAKGGPRASAQPSGDAIGPVYYINYAPTTPTERSENRVGGIKMRPLSGRKSAFQKIQKRTSKGRHGRVKKMNIQFLMNS